MVIPLPTLSFPFECESYAHQQTIKNTSHMAKGKSLCKLLKKIRVQIAEANGIDYAPRKCTFEGDCKGTCPACERELGYLESQLSLKRNMGVPIKIIGLSVALDYVDVNGDMEPDSADNQIYSEESPDSFPSSQYNGDEEEDMEGDIIIKKPDKEAQFPGGNEFLKSFLKKNVYYPQEAIEKGIEGRVVVSFVVDKHGHISNVEVVQSADPLLDAEAVRVVQSMPKWIPAEKDGKAVRSIFRLPVRFKLSNESEN